MGCMRHPFYILCKEMKWKESVVMIFCAIKWCMFVISYLVYACAYEYRIFFCSCCSALIIMNINTNEYIRQCLMCHPYDFKMQMIPISTDSFPYQLLAIRIFRFNGFSDKMIRSSISCGRTFTYIHPIYIIK